MTILLKIIVILSGLLMFEDKKDSLNQEKNLENYFYEVKKSSNTFQNEIIVNEEYNKIFLRHFNEERDKNNGSKYVTLPMKIKVQKYDCDIRPFYEDENITIPPPDSIIFFTPFLEGEENVLYMSPKTEEFLSSFIIGEADNSNKTNRSTYITEDISQRMEKVREYIPVFWTHWSESLFFLSYPQILEFTVGKDGYCININLLSYYGNVYFVPWNKDPELIYEWIQ